MDMLRIGQDILAAQPFSQMVGAELTEFSMGKAEITVPLTDSLKQQNGYAHGGVMAYLADNAMTFAGGTILKEVLTVEMKINYLRPGVGEKLVARAVVLTRGRSQVVTRCEIYSVKGKIEKLCAAAQGTIARRPSDKK